MSYIVLMEKRVFEVDGPAAVKAVDRWLTNPVMPVVEKRSVWRRFVDWVTRSKN